MFGHVSKMSLKCCEGHNLRLDSSSHIEGDKFLVNMRMIHGVNTSGLSYVQYERFCKASGLGVCSEMMFSDVHGVYCEATEMCAQQSIQEAIHMMEQSGNLDSHGIGILTDARHGTRKNSAFSDVIALGCKTHKVVAVKTVTKKDDSVSQRHELFGVKEIYKDFERKDVKVDIHGHDRNSSVNKYLANEHPDIRNANDTWHATKGIAKIMKSIGTGPKKNHEKTWHEQLTDKAASVKTASYYAMKNCNGSSIKLRQFLDNIPEHYQGTHQNCASESRCKVEGVIYESSKCTLTNTVAIDLLSNSIRKLKIYRTPEDYVACIDTHYVESYNNATLIYHDERITFGETEYKRRTHLSIADWNENVDRDTTSIVLFEDTLSSIYDKTLRVTKKMPENAAYRKNTEAIVKARLQQVQTETDIGRLEDKIGCGQIEEVILQGQRELKLARNMLIWKPWEPLIAPPVPDQWVWPIV